MQSSAKLYLGILIWVVGLSATAAIARHGSDSNLLPFIPAILVGGFTYWLGGYFVAEAWRPAPTDLGKILVDHLRIADVDNETMWGYFIGWSMFSISKHWIVNGSFPWIDLFWIVSIGWPILAFVILASPIRRLRKMKLKTAGFAIYERGIRVGSRSIKHPDIVSMRTATSNPCQIRVQLRNESIIAAHPELNETQIADALKLVSERNLIGHSKPEEELVNDAEMEPSLAV